MGERAGHGRSGARDRVRRRAQKPPRIETRVITIFMFFLISATILASRLVVIQVVQASELAKQAKGQYIKRLEIPARRGDIFDRNNQAVAMSVDAVTVFTTPYHVVDKESTAKRVAETLGLSYESVYEKVDGPGGFAYIARKVDPKIADQLKSLGLDGIEFCQDYERIYPRGSLAAQVTGVAGIDEDGLEGLELYYDDILRGKHGYIECETDNRKRPIPGSKRKELPPAQGFSIRVTIDSEIQRATERALGRCLESSGARSAQAVVMDPRTGEILAMATLPTYDINRFTETTSGARRNRCVVDVFEPGSTMKAVVAAAALEDGLYAADTYLHLPEKLNVGSATIGEAHHRPAGDYRFSEVVIESYNVGAALIGQRLGNERLDEALRDFGFGRPCGLDFPGEQWGVLPSVSQWSKTTPYTISFGQGIATTSLQVLRAVAAIGNDGRIVSPHFLQAVLDPQGAVLRKWEGPESGQVLSSSTARQMSAILARVVSEGTGKAAAVNGYSVAGKTGTAQKPEGGRYVKGKYIASFVGYVPAERPVLAIIVVVDEPQDVYYGGAVAAPVFSEIAEFSLRHLRVPPDGIIPVQ